MNTKVLAIAVVAIVGVAAVGSYFLFFNDEEEYDIVLAVGTKNCYEPFWIADKYGFFDEEDVKVKMVYVDGGGTATTTLLAGGADMTLVGADPAIRLFNETDDGMAIATIETARAGASSDFAVRDDANIDIADASTLIKPDGSVKKCGLDITTGYYSGYITYLYSAWQDGQITEAQYNKLRLVDNGSNGGGIVNVPFANQVASLEGNAIQMVCSGNVVTVAQGLTGVSVASAPSSTVVSCCVVIVSGEALAEKRDAVVKILKAFDKACEFIENPATKDEAAEYCAKFYGADGWTTEAQKTFLNSQYWDICHMIGLEDYLNFKAELLGYEGFDCTDRITMEYLDEIHSEGELYKYNPTTKLLEA